MGIKKGLPIDKKIILVKKSGIDVPLAERLKHFRSLDENNTGSQNFGHSKRKQNSISFKTFSVKNPFPTNSKSRRGRIGETGSKRNVEKGAIRKVQRSKGEFVSNLFLVKKKDGGQRPVINLKQPNAYILYCHLHVQHRLCILFSSLGKKFKAICSLPLVRKLVRVPLSLLWFGTSTTNIHKIAKSANDNLTQDKHQNNNLLTRHAIDWSLFRRDCHEPRHYSSFCKI